MTTDDPGELVFNFDTITPRHMLEFKKRTGKSLLEMVSSGQLGEGIDLSSMDEEVVVGIIYVSRLSAGEPVGDETWEKSMDTPFSALQAPETDDEEVTADPTTAS